MTALFSLDANLPVAVHVVGFRGTEQLLAPYEFRIGLLAREDDDFDLDAAIGERATLRVTVPGDATPFVFHGIIASLEHLQVVDDQGLYEAVLVPQLWHLTQSHHCRVFVEQSIPAIIEATLKRNGFGADDYSLALQGTYPTMAHVCQYHESDLDFISRWMEREGIYYFFEQGDEREKLIITDNKSTHESLGAPVRYRPGSVGDTGVGQSFGFFRGKARALPQKVTLRDYDYDAPSLDVRGQAAIGRGRGEIHVHGENFTSPGEGGRLAAVRAESFQARRKVFQAHGRAFLLRPGYLFSVTDHPRGSFNAAYLTTALEHHGNQSAADPVIREVLDLEHEDEYRVDVVAIPSTVQFRPQRVTPKPRIYGMENAVVDGGASSDYAQIDRNGCYKVKIDFDESGLGGGGASTWVRMLQPHGGTNEGFHFPLRAGTEVLLTFLGGDPDRPVISGVLPNATTPSPVVEGNLSQNVIQTGGLNRIEMEDLDGKQHVRMQTPTESSHIFMGAPHEGFNMAIRTAGDGQHVTGRNYDVEIGADNTKHVVGEVISNYDKSEEKKIKGNKITTIQGFQTNDVVGPKTTTVEGDVSEEYQKNFDNRIVGRSYRHIGARSFQESIEENGSLTWVGDDFVKFDIAGDFQVNSKASGIHTYDLELRHTVGTNYTRTTGGNDNTTVVGDYSLTAKSVTVNVIGGDYSTTVTGKYGLTTMNDHVDVNLGAADIEIFAGMHNEITMGLQTEINLGLSVAFTAGVDVEMVPVSFEATGLDISKVGLENDNGVAQISAHKTRSEVCAAMFSFGFKSFS